MLKVNNKNVTYVTLFSFYIAARLYSPKWFTWLNIKLLTILQNEVCFVWNSKYCFACKIQSFSWEQRLSHFNTHYIVLPYPYFCDFVYRLQALENKKCAPQSICNLSLTGAGIALLKLNTLLVLYRRGLKFTVRVSVRPQNKIPWWHKK
jgi:hypothetical protein